MTGYAVTSRECAAGTVTIELKSVNSRFLDLQFRLNDDLRAMEPLLREAIMARVARGKVECRLSYARKSQGDSKLEANEAVLTSLAALEQSVRNRFEAGRRELSFKHQRFSVGDCMTMPSHVGADVSVPFTKLIQLPMLGPWTP